jgi:hypothetical protein
MLRGPTGTAAARAIPIDRIDFVRQALRDRGIFDSDLVGLSPHQIVSLFDPTDSPPSAGPRVLATGPTGAAILHTVPAGPATAHIAATDLSGPTGRAAIDMAPTGPTANDNNPNRSVEPSSKVSMVEKSNPASPPASALPSGKRRSLAERTKDFMSRVVPWPLSGEPGYINLEYQVQNVQRPKKPFWISRSAVDIDAFLALAKQKISDKAVTNIYFCLSQQSTFKYRSSATARYLKAIWLDLDVKLKGYGSIDEAITALAEFIKHYDLPGPSAIIASGSGLHVYWISTCQMTVDEWLPYANGLKAAVLSFGLKCDAGVIADAARVLRLPGTRNCKTDPPKPVRFGGLQPTDIDFAADLKMLLSLSPPPPRHAPKTGEGANSSGMAEAFADLKTEPFDWIGADLYDNRLLPLGPIMTECGFIKTAILTGGKEYAQPLWNLTTLAAVFIEDGHDVAHRMADKHLDYTIAETEELWERKNREHEEGVGPPGCIAIKAAGCEHCEDCRHLPKDVTSRQSPVNLGNRQTRVELPNQAEISFADPYADFTGPPFPLDVLPPTLNAFVLGEHRNMGVDASGIAMAALACVAGATHAETLVKAGEGWFERPIFWVYLIGPSAVMKTPPIDKAKQPLIDIDNERRKTRLLAYIEWKHAQAQQGEQTNTKKSKRPPPPRPARCIIMDITPEKVAEMLARDPCGSLLIQDELADWINNFERYNSNGRGFYLRCHNGGPHNKDRVGKGVRDEDAEIYVENLALCVLGGITPERLVKFDDLTSDGLLQRGLSCLMRAAKPNDMYHSVAEAEAQYDLLIRAINIAPPETYVFDQDTFAIRDQVIAELHQLGQVQGFPSALISAINKLRGQFARLWHHGLADA